MADPIPDGLLREIVEGTYCGLDEGAAIAAELIAHRNTINMAEGEADHALNGEWFADLCEAIRMLRAERDAARADLREAIELLRAHGQAPGWLLSVGKFEAVKYWNRRYGELLAKHKETP